MNIALSAPRSLDEIKPHPYPHDLLEGCDSALMLFAAGFYGRNDCYWAAKENVTHVTAVDIDGEKLAAMRAIYPSNWNLIQADVYDWSARNHLHYDVVTIDGQIADADRNLGLCARWCALAEKAVVLTTMDTTIRRYALRVFGQGPIGWRISRLMPRNGLGAYWLVLERDAPL